MFENFGKTVSKFVLTFIVVLLAGVFALQFGGPQAQGCSTEGALVAAEVYGETITSGEYQSAVRLAEHATSIYGMRAGADQLREGVLSGLVERTLLARAAREVGFAANPQEVMRQTARDATGMLSIGADAPEYFPRGPIPLPVKDKDGNFDLDAAKRFIQWGLRRSVEEYAREQSEEMLAQNMRELVASMVAVSPREVWDAYVREKETARVRFARFRPQFYRETLDVTEEGLTAWMAENSERVDQEYEAQKHRYTGLEKQVRARHILIKPEEGGNDTAAQEAREKIDALLMAARAPGADFSALAREHSEDTVSARRGGDLGFNPRGRMARPFDEAQFALEEGQISDIVETQFGFHIIKVEQIREGDVPEDEAKRELSEALYRASQSDDRAREAAEAALEGLRSGGDMDALATELRGGPAPGDEEEGAEPTPEPDPLSPQVEETRDFGRGDSPITGLPNGSFVQGAFDLTEESPLPEATLKIGTDYFVFRLEERSFATEEGFDEPTQRRISEGLGRAKEREAIALLIHRLRRDAESAGALRVNHAIVVVQEDDSQ